MSLRLLSSSAVQTDGAASAFLKEQEIVMFAEIEDIGKSLELLLAVQTKLEESITPPSRQKQECSEKDNFYGNCDPVIRNLREELPV